MNDNFTSAGAINSTYHVTTLAVNYNWFVKHQTQKQYWVDVIRLFCWIRYKNIFADQNSCSFLTFYSSTAKIVLFKSIVFPFNWFETSAKNIVLLQFYPQQPQNSYLIACQNVKLFFMKFLKLTILNNLFKAMI